MILNYQRQKLARRGLDVGPTRDGGAWPCDRARKPAATRVVNVLVLWNTLYLEAALRAEGFSVREEDVARLSPLGCEHINLLGRYAFCVPDQARRGELRPLRNPAAAAENR